MNQFGYDILKKRYSEPIKDDPSGFLHFIQEMYLYRLEEQFSLIQCVDRAIDSMPTEKVRTLAKVNTMTPFAFGMCMKIFPQPFYEECLEIARFVSKLKGFHFHSQPYVIGDNHTTWENRYFVAIKVWRGEMPSLDKEEMEEVKECIRRWAVCNRTNVYHNIFGSSIFSQGSLSGEVESKLMVSCCSMSKKEADKYTTSGRRIKI